MGPDGYGRSVDLDWPRLRQRCLIAEDTRILALDKPAGLAVTGERHGTDLVRLAAENGETWYPVHRIDKVTSGVVLFAKDLAAHGPLTQQFGQRTAAKTYLAITLADQGFLPLPDTGVIDLPLREGRKNRVRVAAPRERIRRDHDRWYVTDADLLPGRSYPSRTEFTTLLRRDPHTVLAVRPITGRRHQIRVHLAWLGHPVAGDPLFWRAQTEEAARTLLHSWRLRVRVPWHSDLAPGEELTLRADPPSQFWQVGHNTVVTDPAALHLADLAE